jgi:hypothetical protein
MRRGLFALLGGALVALAGAAIVLGANPSKEKIAFTAAGQAQAKAEVLRRKDVGRGWVGGSKKPELSSVMPCTNYRPKQSDLVLIGAAETSFRKPELVIDNEVQVLRTAAMVRLDWQRTVTAPQVMPCLREGLTKSLTAAAKLRSFRRIAFPHVARYTNAFRAVFSVTTAVGVVPVEVDIVALGARRNEVTLTLTGSGAARTVLHSAELRLAKLLAKRLRP